MSSVPNAATPCACLPACLSACLGGGWRALPPMLLACLLLICSDQLLMLAARARALKPAGFPARAAAGLAKYRACWSV
ncbi:hypothetical protein DFJ73DRAFT_858414 [Zopfochytrium polystomum]|nr:hypothetical protein DFJ73DRAFT_858414 [Zopfochytrium polystomum]